MLITGLLTVIFAILAGLNMMTKYTNLNLVKRVANKHRIFGMLSTLTALVHMVIAIANGELRITGLLALVSLILTGVFGILFYKLKDKKLYLAHRIMGPVAFLLILIHVIFNVSF